jgi:hypothetical protein
MAPVVGSLHVFRSTALRASFRFAQNDKVFWIARGEWPKGCVFSD